jgi:hypothetical protein
VEPDASAYQLLTNLFIAVADVQRPIVEEFVLHDCNDKGEKAKKK